MEEEGSDKYRLLTVIFLVICVLLGTLSASLYVQNRKLIEYNKNLESKLKKLSEELSALKEENEALKRQNKLLQEELSRVLEESTTESREKNFEGYDWVYIFGVYVQESGFFTYVLKGLAMKAYIRFAPGSGRVFVSTTPKIGIYLQKSAETAFAVACRLANLTRNKLDCFIVIAGNMSVNVVDGPSAGAALTVLMTSILTGHPIRKDVGITGTIEPDGSIGPVGGILEKAIAAAEAGVKIFLVPKGQSKIVRYVKKTYKIAPGFYITIPERKIVDLEEELRSRGFNIKVFEVSNIQEALEYFFGVKG